MSRAMKDSGIPWIGEIPEHWEVKPLKWDFDIIAGATPKTDNANFWDGNIPWITPADYKTEDRYISQGRRNLSEEGMASCATTLLPKGSIIFSKRAPIGLVVINSQPLCTNQGCIGCVPKKDDARYYYYTMSIFTEQYELFGSGTTFKEISASNFADFRLPHPSLTEQQAISDYLDRKCAEVDEMIGLQEQIIEELKAYKQSKVKELFDTYMATETFTTLKLGAMASLVTKQTGFDYSNTISHALVGELSENTIPYLQTKHFKDGYWNYDTDYYIPKDVAIRFPKILLNKKSLLFSIVGASIGNVAVFPATTTAFLGGAICKVDLYKDCDYEYIKQYMMSIYGQEQISSKINSSAQGTITVQNVRDFKIPMFDNPNIQKAITEEVSLLGDRISSLIVIKLSKIDSLKEYKKSIIYEYVTGKMEVK